MPRDHRRTSGTSREFVWFGALTSVVYLVWVALVHTAGFDVHPDALSWGAALDLTVTVPLAYWLLVVRRARASRRSILAVVALSVFGAKLLLPAGHAAFLPWLHFALVPIELGVILLAISRVRAAGRARQHDGDMRDHDMLTQFESTLAVLLGNATVGRALGHEVAIFYYALGGRSRTPNYDVLTDVQFAAAPPFATAVFFALLGMFVIETVILHLLVAQGSTRVAWILTAASVYSIIWLVAFQRSAGQRLSVLRTDAVVLRIGLRCDATVAWGNIVSVRFLTWRDIPARTAGYLNAAKPSDPNILIEFHDAVRIEGPYGITRTVTGVGVRLERPEVFVSLAAARVST